MLRGFLLLTQAKLVLIYKEKPASWVIMFKEAYLDGKFLVS